MGYTLLKELYYKDSQAYNNLYKERFESQYTHHIDFKIGDSRLFVYSCGSKMASSLTAARA